MSGWDIKIHVRPTVQQDLQYVLQAERALENRHYVGQWTFEEHLDALRHANLLHLIIETQDAFSPVGYTILAGMLTPGLSIELRRLVVTDKGKGYGREMLRWVKQLAFDELKTHRLWLDVRDHNLRAQRLYQAEGFITEGTLRECIKVQGHFESLIIMSMLQSEYRQRQ